MAVHKRTISILGCGWLGFPLAKKLIGNDWSVKGSTTSPHKIDLLKEHEIEPYLLELPSQKNMDLNIFKSEYLLINIPPGRADKERLKDYLNVINEILDFTVNRACVKKIIFISSTSVYGAEFNMADENTACQPVSAAGKEILKAEKLVCKTSIPHLILRFGGLAGPGRHPGRFLEGRTGITIGNQSINFLHLDDAIGIITYMLENKLENELYNVVAPMHPRKKEFYTKMAKAINLIPPTFIDATTQYIREVSGDKLLKQTNYEFIHPDPMLFSHF